ncbi:MAG: hypothetical protein IPG74_13950 [Flavobacteriales bacterium]|nr:hypothetical protein [Flavobacteriales bacterium]
MKRTMVSISLSPEGMGKIKATPELQQAEMQFINDWKEQGILESFFITTNRTGPSSFSTASKEVGPRS